MIFGLDLGIRRVAAVCWDPVWVWELKRERAADRRCWPTEEEIGTHLGASLAIELMQLDGVGSSVFFYERPIPVHSTNTLVSQSLSAGALLAQLPGQKIGIPSPGTWKKEICGHGSLDKDGVRAWLEASHPSLAALCGEGTDLYDAACIALYGGAVLAQAGGV